ncbi:MAG: hypothetical protein A2621_01650 [Alphaproteobacteria bacterium RIFCSPHIGHO2_01_FULL_41_14]|nr:MAG: hypothetical protein A2065_01705 [Alphaproteobacteria bacterium GWB1_45_5]OFW89601.1 MAG: hypothetical protein A2621_01650 [Alphaproteobacteria bacterium RIFCSPHIGHO2_01_FULL_41_14]HCI48487.1 hypothetical protein [Holosporales bacterium]
MKKVSMSSIVVESIRFTRQNYKSLGKLVIIPFLLSVGMHFLPDVWSKIGFSPLLGIAFPPSIHTVISSLLDELILVLWLPKWIQYCENPKGTIKAFEVHAAYGRFFLYSLILSAPPLVAIEWWAPLFSHLKSWAPAFYKPWIVVGVSGYLMINIRLSFLLPALALSKPTGFKRAWIETRPLFRDLLKLNVLYILYVLGLCLPFVFIIMLIVLSLILLKISFEPFLEKLSPIIGIVVSYYFYSIYYTALTKFYLKSRKA